MRSISTSLPKSLANLSHGKNKIPHSLFVFETFPVFHPAGNVHRVRPHLAGPRQPRFPASIRPPRSMVCPSSRLSAVSNRIALLSLQTCLPGSCRSKSQRQGKREPAPGAPTVSNRTALSTGLPHFTNDWQNSSDSSPCSCSPSKSSISSNCVASSNVELTTRAIREISAGNSRIQAASFCHWRYRFDPGYKLKPKASAPDSIAAMASVSFLTPQIFTPT